MENKRDLLVLMKTDAHDQHTLDEAVACLHRMLVDVECNEIFCQVHELVARNRITSRRKKILKAVAQNELKPFHFLIGKN